MNRKQIFYILGQFSCKHFWINHLYGLRHLVMSRHIKREEASDLVPVDVRRSNT